MSIELYSLCCSKTTSTNQVTAMPDSITTWQITAISLSKENGEDPHSGRLYICLIIFLFFIKVSPRPPRYPSLRPSLSIFLPLQMSIILPAGACLSHGE